MVMRAIHRVGPRPKAARVHHAGRRGGGGGPRGPYLRLV